MGRQYYNHEEAAFDKVLEKVARKICPDYFQNEIEFEEGGRRLKLKDQKEIIICKEPAEKNILANYSFHISFFEKYRYSIMEGWQIITSNELSLRTPKIRLIRRDKIDKSPYQVADAMKNIFKANALLVDQYIWTDWSRPAIKNLLKTKNIFLIFTDETK